MQKIKKLTQAPTKLTQAPENLTKTPKSLTQLSEKCAEIPEIPGWAAHQNLCSHTWMRIKDSQCAYMWKPKSANHIVEFLKYIKSNATSVNPAFPEGVKNMPYLILGNGSNTLIGLFKGVIISMLDLHSINLDGDELVAEAGALNKNIVQYAGKYGLGNFEFLYTIPGTIGASACMNAGAHGYEIKDYIKWVEVININTCEIVRLLGSDISWEYRASSLLEQYIVTKVSLKYEKVDSQIARDYIKKIMDYVNTKQPRAYTLGSTFKNPPGYAAWQLVERLVVDGLDNASSDNAYFSPLHYNFLINTGEATGLELLNLAERVRKKILVEYGIFLEFEIKIHV